MGIVKLYFSGLGGAQKFIIEHVKTFPIQRALASYAMPKQFRRLKDMGFESIFIDSGAWSAFNSGIEIDIDSFIDFGKEVAGEVDAIANLDVIADYAGSLKNYEYITKRGLDVWPVYHFGEPADLLDDYLSNTDHICIGGLVGTGVHPTRILRNLKELYNKYPGVKVHTFGVNCFDVLMPLPIYSTDALTWRSGSRFGDVFVDGRRYKVGRKVSRIDPVYMEVSAWLKEHFDMNLDDEDFKFHLLDLYNLTYLYNELEVKHSKLDLAVLTLPQVLF